MSIASTNGHGLSTAVPVASHAKIDTAGLAEKVKIKNLEFFYLQNCPYEGMWKYNSRRFSERTKTWDELHKYGHDYTVIFVGDAASNAGQSGFAIPQDKGTEE